MAYLQVEKLTEELAAAVKNQKAENTKLQPMSSILEGVDGASKKSADRLKAVERDLESTCNAIFCSPLRDSVWSTCPSVAKIY